MPAESGSSAANLPKRFGRYEVVRELGKGAMGVVFLGRDPVIGRLVALKTIRVATEDDIEQREFNERFLREAQAAGTLSHPNIVTVHDVGEEDETSFIAMEYVEGKNLKQIIRENDRLPFERTADVIAQVASALDYAHRKGIVHRDVKPANIIITPDGTVKITDFGIAKIETSSLTETGQFLGTPNYMSPEQVTSEAVDGRSDIFSLGVVLYELLTKRKPFFGDNVTSISYKIVHEAYPRLQTIDPGIPGDFEPIVAKALAKDPASRYQRAADFGLALAELGARQAEYQLIRNLGEMVAQAEKLGPVAPVETPAAPPATIARPPSPETTPGVPVSAPSPDVTGALEALARRREDLNPQLVLSTPMRDLEGSTSEWSLDTDAVKKPLPREPIPSTPGTMITDLPRAAKKRLPGESLATPEASLSTRAVTSERTVFVTPKPEERGAPRPTEAPPSGFRPIPALDMSTLAKAPDFETSVRRGSSVTPPSLPDGAGSGPRPPALPPEATGSIRVTSSTQVGRPAPPLRTSTPSSVSPAAPATARSVWPPPEETTLGMPAPLPIPPPVKERTAPLRVEIPAPLPAKERTGPLKVEATPPALSRVRLAPLPAPARETSAPLRLEGTAASPKTKPAPGKAEAPRAAPTPVRAGAPRPENAPEPSGERETLAVMLRRDVKTWWVWAIVGVLVLPALVIVGALFARSRQIVPTGERDMAAAAAAVSHKKRLLEDGNRLLADGKLEEARQAFLELARVAPESSTAKEALSKVDRLLSRKTERENVATEVARRLVAAKTAQAAGDLPAAAAAAEAVLALDPGHPEATELRRAATEAIRRLPRAEQRKAEERLNALRVEPPAAAATSAGGASAPPEPAAGPPLHVILRSSFGSGTLIVRMNGAEVLRRSLGSGAGPVGLLEADVELPSRAGELRAWFFSADGAWRGYGNLRVDLPEGVRRSIVLATSGDRKLSMALE